THAAVLLNPGNAANGPVRQAMGMTAKALQVELQPFEVQGASDLDRVFPAMADSKIDALIVHDDQVLIGNAQQLPPLPHGRNFPRVASWNSQRRADWRPMGGILSNCVGARPTLWARFSRGPCQPICQSSSRQKLKSPSNSRPLISSACHS